MRRLGIPRKATGPTCRRRRPRRGRPRCERLEDAHTALVAAINELPEEKLFEPTNDPRDRETGSGVSYYVLLHGIVQHDVYHAGQIALVKKGAMALIR